MFWAEDLLCHTQEYINDERSDRFRPRDRDGRTNALSGSIPTLNAARTPYKRAAVDAARRERSTGARKHQKQ